MAYPKDEVELPKKENLIDGAGNKRVNRITKKGNFDGQWRGWGMQWNCQKRKF